MEALAVEALFVAHLAATLTMFGVIWVVQLVHYPLFGGVGEAGWPAYEAAHQRRITWVVFPAMTVELLTAAALVWTGLGGVPRWSLWLGLALVGVVWASTAFVQVPLHGALGRGWDAAAHGRLVGTNWVRTAAWSARAGLVLWWTARLLA